MSANFLFEFFKISSAVPNYLCDYLIINTYLPLLGMIFAVHILYYSEVSSSDNKHFFHSVISKNIIL